MTLTLPPDLDRFVQDQIANGQFPKADDVIEAGLRLLQARRDELCGLIAVGVEQARQGLTKPFNPVETLAQVRAARNPLPGG
jgi:putative addiction module CopG family antidote